MTKEQKSTSTRMIVAGIDFGTTYSGYAYSFDSDWSKVLMNEWPGGQLISHKAPTALLLNPDQSFNSFGFEAEKNYAEIAEDGDDEGRTSEDYFYFHRFKMMLKDSLKKRVHREIKCKDECGREVKAMLVFKYSIRYLKDHLLESIAKSKLGDKIDIDDINFVLTVPAIWDDTAKMFMYEAAVKAGIPEDQLEIALEPEAASIYCQLMHTDDRQRDNTGQRWTREPGVKYMVIDLGGGTADIIVHQLQENGTLAEIIPASGGEMGGTCVDNAFRQFLKDVFQMDVFEILKKHPETIIDHIEFWQYFEVKKREKIDSKHSNMHIIIPVALTDVVKESLNLNEKSQGRVLEEILNRSNYGDREVSSQTGRIIVSTEIFKTFFNPTIEKLISHLTRIENELASNVDVVLLVGGFSECDLVQERLRQHFGKDRVVIPFDASLAVLKGAVFFGHRKELISRRVARFTYGMQIWPKFDGTLHSLKKKELVDGEERCRNVFLKFVSKGDPMERGLRKSYIFNPLKRGKNHLECGVFVSDNEDPKYVDDPGCFKLGALTMPMRSFESQTEIEESLIFGETYIKVEACNRRTNEKYEITFDLLSPELDMPSR